MSEQREVQPGVTVTQTAEGEFDRRQIAEQDRQALDRLRERWPRGLGMTLTFDRNTCQDIEKALNLEWMVTNGLGGYAASTIVGVNTRRYHGLLIAVPGSREHLVLLSKLEEEVESAGVQYDLSTNEYAPNTLYPRGFTHLEEFRLENGLPVWTWRGGEWELQKRLWMAHGQNTTYITYTLSHAPGPVTLTLRPLANYRDFNRETRGAVDWNFIYSQVDGNNSVLRAYEGAHPYILSTYPRMERIPAGVWYWNFMHRREQERGLDYTEDLYDPVVLRRVLAPGETQLFIVSSEPIEQVDTNWPRVLEHERARCRTLVAQSGLADERPEVGGLVLAADQFIVHRPPAGESAQSSPEAVTTVVAGYPWFGDWGRDTMVSLPGLLLSTARYPEAASVLRTYSRYIDQGMLPNWFPSMGEVPEYNTVDATLWYFVAIWRYVQSTGSLELAGELYPFLTDIIDWHLRGTRYGIQVDPRDGLLRAGVPGVQLTWMDIKVNGYVVTPRYGKPVEINALWYNALRITEELGKMLQREPASFQPGELAKRVAESYPQRFWFMSGGYLYDVVDGPSGDDSSLRPNQIFALALPFPLITGERARSVLKVVGETLLTPYGLRSLSPNDPAYRGHYEGNVWQRDTAYHQGTVWPWLMGAYIDARRRAYGPGAETQKLFEPLFQQLANAGLGSISEIFDGDPPYTPRGCPAQAWSVAEVLRAWKEGMA